MGSSLSITVKPGTCNVIPGIAINYSHSYRGLCGSGAAGGISIASYYGKSKAQCRNREQEKALLMNRSVSSWHLEQRTQEGG